MISLILSAAIVSAPAGAAVAPAIANPVATPPASVQPAEDALETEQIAAGEGKAAALKLADALEQSYVIPAAGARMAAMLRGNAAAGRYDSGARGEVAERFNKDLRAVQRDGHLRVGVPPADAKPGSKPPRGPHGNGPPAIQAAKWLTPTIAYIRFSAFSSTPEEVADVAKFMADHSAAKTMIFDLRNNRGGEIGEMNVIFPYLYAKATPLVHMEVSRSNYDKDGSPFELGPSLTLAKTASMVTLTHSALPGKPTPLRRADVLLLVSNGTASAAEHFTLALKSSGRATLIGEATAGANHFGDISWLGDHLAAFLPVGRTYDIATGKDWEGDGIAPDIAVDPRRALLVALERAGVPHDEAVRIDAGEVPAMPVHRDRPRG
jgi:hypothetical protein